LKRWPVSLKCRIVEETFVPGASVAEVARRNNANANQVFEWRKQYWQGRLAGGKAAAMAVAAPPELLRIGVIDHDRCIRPLTSADGHPTTLSRETGKATPLPGVEHRPAPGIIEIELPGGIKVGVDGNIDDAALRRVLAVVKEAA